MHKLNLVIILTMVVALGFMFCGCGGKKQELSELSGTWKSDKNKEPIKINFEGNQKVIEIGNNSVPITIKNFDEGNSFIKMDAKPANGKTEAWSFMQVWDDNGSSFKLKFEHDGLVEMLTRG